MATFDQRGQQVETQYNVAGNLIFQGAVTLQTVTPSPADVADQRNLAILRDKVKSFWIEGILEKSIHAEVALELGKDIDLEAVEHPWEQVLELPGQEAQTVPAGTKMNALFTKMGQAMLILGEPGSGKTITLLELARELIAQVEVDNSFSRPVPVVFNLSSWARGQPLIDWLVSELSTKYQIPKRISRPWLENNRLLPLLDGLDEVRAADRAACVNAINSFGQEFGLAGVAVCSRWQEYIALPVRLRLNGAIRLQPLTPAQVDDYLTRAGPSLDTLRLSLQQDEPLRELAQSPLMLNIMSLVYQDGAALTGQGLQTVETRRHHLFNTYITHMFNRKGKADKSYTDQQTSTWLAWLAQNMKQRHQAIFLIERLQPSWLSTTGERWCYVIASRLIQGALVGLLGGLVFGLIDEMYFSFIQPDNAWITDLRLELRGNLLVQLGQGLWKGLLIGLLVGLSVGLLDMVRFEQDNQADGTEAMLPLPQTMLRILGIGLLGWLLGGLVAWPSFDFSAGLIFGISAGLIFGLQGRQQSLSNDIQTVEALKLSWSGVLRGGAVGLFLGMLFGVLIGLLVGALGYFMYGLTFGYGWARGIFYGLGIGLSVGLAGAIFGGLSSTVIELRTWPNQGIRLSLKNAGLTGLLAGLLSGLLFGLVYGLLFGLSLGLSIGLVVGVSIGLLATLWYGNFEVIQHYILRFILWRTDKTPCDYVHFLDYAAERAFLRKVGGGYIFIHRLLLEHFARSEVDGLPASRPTPVVRHAWQWQASLVALAAIFLAALASAGLAGYQLYVSAESLKLIEQGKQLAQAGDIAAALAKYNEAERQASDPNFEISAASWNTLCWFGSLWNHAAEVRFACERAVELAPDEGAYRDSRGVARALLGDYPGAMADFKFFIDWSRQNGQYERYGLSRERWLTQLEAGQNPFDQATLATLRNE
jgi:hypothetical protein